MHPCVLPACLLQGYLVARGLEAASDLLDGLVTCIPLVLRSATNTSSASPPLSPTPPITAAAAAAAAAVGGTIAAAGAATFAAACERVAVQLLDAHLMLGSRSCMVLLPLLQACVSILEARCVHSVMD
jgi:hypothetical protein